MLTKSDVGGYAAARPARRHPRCRRHVSRHRMHATLSELVKPALCFLDELGFVRTEIDAVTVHFTRGAVRLEVSWDRYSFEIDVRLAFEGKRYTLSEFIRTADPTAEGTFRYPLATSAEGIAAGLNQVSRVLEQYCAPALNGDPAVFAEIERRRPAWAEAIALDAVAYQTRPKAEAAFRQRDYALAADLYSSIRALLTPAERKKLSVAQARSGRLAG